MDLVNFTMAVIVFVIVVAILLWAVRQILGVWSVDPRLATTVYALLVIVFVWAFLQWTGVLFGAWPWRVRP